MKANTLAEIAMITDETLQEFFATLIQYVELFQVDHGCVEYGLKIGAQG